MSDRITFLDYAFSHSPVLVGLICGVFGSVAKYFLLLRSTPEIEFNWTHFFHEVFIGAFAGCTAVCGLDEMHTSNRGMAYAALAAGAVGPSSFSSIANALAKRSKNDKQP